MKRRGDRRGSGAIADPGTPRVDSRCTTGIDRQRPGTTPGPARGTRFPLSSGWPPDVLADLPRITLVGTAELSLESHQGLESFSGDELRVATRAGCVRVSGRHLVIASVGPLEIRVKGQILSVTFPAPPDAGT